jgi:hypothetical protein
MGYAMTWAVWAWDIGFLYLIGLISYMASGLSVWF